MPHSDAASRVHSLYRLMSRMFTGCRIGVRHDSYREPRLSLVAYSCHFYISSNRFADEPNRPPFVLQKAVYCTLKGRLLEAKRRPFGNLLIISGLSFSLCSSGLLDPISLIRHNAPYAPKLLNHVKPPPFGRARVGVWRVFGWLPSPFYVMLTYTFRAHVRHK